MKDAMAGEQAGDEAGAPAATAYKSSCIVIVLADPASEQDLAALCRQAGFEKIPPVVVVVDDHDQAPAPAAVSVSAGDFGLRRRTLGRLVLRATPPDATALARVRLDPPRRLVYVEGRSLELPKREFDLLAYLMARPGKTVPRPQILRDVWGFASGSTATITVHMRQLRRKVEADPANPRHLLTVRGVGYRFES